MQDKLKEMFGELTAFESEIRVFIENVLEKVYSHNWIKQAIPKVFIDDWIQKREKDIKQGKIPEDNLISYADFSHYKDIIIHNWKHFSVFFEDKEKLRVRLEDLNNLCRIVTMHTRTLTEDEIGMGNISIRWLRSKMEVGSSGRKEGIREIEDIHPVFRANPFMIEEGASLVRGEKRPSEATLKHIDMQLIDSKGIPLFAEIKWTSIAESQVGEYKKLIGDCFKNYRLMWVIPDDFQSAMPELKKLGVEVKVFSREGMIKLIGIRNTATKVLMEIKEMLMKPFEYAIQNEPITFEDVIHACYFDGVVEIEGRQKRVGLKQSAIGRYLDLIRCVVISPVANSLPELSLEFIWELLAASYSYKRGKFIVIERHGFASIPKVAHVHSSLGNTITEIWKWVNNFHIKYKNTIRASYGNDVRKYDLTYRIVEKIVLAAGETLNVKTFVKGLVDMFVMSPLKPTPKIFHTTLNQWVRNSVDTSGYENDFAKRIIEIATLKRILIPQRGITIMWVLAPRYEDGKLKADRVPCQSFIFNKDPKLYLEAI